MINYCTVNVLGRAGIGKSTIINSMLEGSKNSYDLYYTSSYFNNSRIYENGHEVGIEFRELRSLQDLEFLSQKLEPKDKAVFIVVLGTQFSGRNDEEMSWLSYISQYYPSSIVFIVTQFKRFQQDFFVEQLRLKFEVVRDIFYIGLYQEELEDFIWFVRQTIINEFTNRLEYVRDKIKANYLSKNPTLDLGKCYLTSLKEVRQLFDCTHLEELILSNEWGEHSHGKWKRIESENNGGKNRFRSIPSSIRKLMNLQRLIIGGDWNIDGGKTNKWRIQDVGWTRSLRRLEYLNVSNNEITRFPDLRNQKKLRILHFNNNFISKVGRLPEKSLLEELYLSNNKLDDCSFLKDQINLNTVDLHGNSIKDLTPIKTLIERIGVQNSKWELNTANVAQNPLETPPIEVINIGKEAILSYFRDIQIDTPYTNNEIKLILVGNSEVGKTTMAKYLDNEKDLEKPHPPTLWLEERRIQSKYVLKKISDKCTINLFDFGGHDYYHDTHHLFYGTNSIYIILWDQKTNNLNFRTTIQRLDDNTEVKIQTQDYPLKYWLDSVKHFTKDIESESFDFQIDKSDGYKSLALVIQNKVAQKEDIVHLNNEKLSADYPFIFDFGNISILNPRRNLVYFDELFTQMLESAQIVGARLPGYYGVIKDNLNEYSGKHFMTIVEFRGYCNGFLSRPITIAQASYLASYLKQLGHILYYPNGNDEDKVFIKKDWIVKSLYKILGKLSEKRGEFDEMFIYEKLRPDLTDSEIKSFIELMIEFKIIFKHPLSKTLIAPLYLPNAPSDSVKLFIDEKRIPYRRFEFDGFIHKGVTLSLFQEYGKLVLNESIDGNKNLFYYWKNGLIVKDSKTGELILIELFLGDINGNASIDIVKLNNRHITNFSDEIVSFVKTINKDYDIEEMVTLDGKTFVSLDILNENAKQGRLIFIEQSKRDFNKDKSPTPQIHLKDYSMFLEDGIKKKKVVISYSKKDLARVHSFIRYLKPLVDLDLIEQPWYCTLANPATEWDEKIQSEFKEADIVFFMVSEYFYSTQYIIDKEIKTTIDRYDFDKSVKIIPIILEHYDWERKPPYNLQRFSAMPFQAKPISDFNNEKLAWNTITSAVRKMIEKDLDPGQIDIISREMQEFYERQVEGKLNKNS
jgi:internalin A